MCRGNVATTIQPKDWDDAKKSENRESLRHKVDAVALEWCHNMSDLMSIAGGNSDNEANKGTVERDLRQGCGHWVNGIASMSIGQCIVLFGLYKPQNIVGKDVSKMVSSKAGLAYYCDKGENIEFDGLETSKVVGDSTLQSANLHIGFS